VVNFFIKIDVMRVLILVLFLTFSQSVFAQHGNHAVSGYADSVNAGLIPVDTMKKSTHRMAMANIGDVHVHLEYGSPGVRGRVIWGGLVPFDEVWSAGAHNATSISFSNAVSFAGKKVEAGTYAFFLIPGKEKFTVILNKKFKQHLADEYDMKDDILRVEFTPETPQKTVQRLTYEVVEQGKNKGQLRFSWENKLISIPVSVK
jgi:hypothetical protein